MLNNVLSMFLLNGHFLCGKKRWPDFVSDVQVIMFLTRIRMVEKPFGSSYFSSSLSPQFWVSSSFILGSATNCPNGRVNMLAEKAKGCFASCIFFFETQYKLQSRCLHTRLYTHLYKHWAGGSSLKINEFTTCVSLSTATEKYHA